MSVAQDLQFDELKMYFGYDYNVTEAITIHQPTIGEIIEFGEERMFASISPFLSNPTSQRLILWENGIDWNNITDYDMFLLFYPGLNPEDTKLIFGDFDFSRLKRYQNEDGEIFLCADGEIYVDEFVYTEISEYLRLMFNYHPKVEKAKGKATKNAIIDEEKMNRRIAERTQKKNSGSFLLPLISSMVNHPGFKYKTSELKEVGIVEFMDSVERLQVYENTIALLRGTYSGMVDTKKIDKEEFNWLRDLHSDKK